MLPDNNETQRSRSYKQYISQKVSTLKKDYLFLLLYILKMEKNH